MTKTDTLHMRIEHEIKNNAENILKQLGLSSTDAINVFFRQIILTGGLPFNIKLPVPNETTVKAMEEAERILSDPGTKKYNNFSKLLAEVKAEDENEIPD